MDLAWAAGLLVYYLLLAEADLLRHRVYRSGGQEEEREDDFQASFIDHHFIFFKGIIAHKFSVLSRVHQPVLLLENVQHNS